MQGDELKATDGMIGSIRDFYFNDQQWTISYVIVEVGSWLTSRDVLIPAELLGSFDPQLKSVNANVSRLQVKRSAPVEFKKPVSEQRNRQNKLYLVSNLPGFAASKSSVPRLNSHVVASSDRHLRSGEELRGSYWVLGKDGDIGPVHDFVLDDKQWTIRYIVVNVGWWFAVKLVLVPPRFVERISFDKGAVSTSLCVGAVHDAPSFDATTSLAEFEHRLGEYWKQQEIERGD